MNFKKKYLKYKFKYINLKQNGSGKFDNLKKNPITFFKKVDDVKLSDETKLNRIVNDDLAFFKKVDDVKLSDEETKLNRVIEYYFPIMKHNIHKIKQMITYYKNKPLPHIREKYFNNNYYVNKYNQKIYHDFNKDNEFLKDIDEKTRIALFRIYPYYKNLEIELKYINNLFKQSREERIININNIAKNNLLYHTESFELQTDRINEWITLQKAKKVQKICKIIRDNINHIKFDTFLKGLLNSFKNFLNKIKEPKKDYIIIIADTNTKKSNYWCVLLIMNYINENKLKQPFDILANTRDALLLYNNEILKNIEYVIFDDCSYSGNQLSGHINRQKFKHDGDEITRDEVAVVKDRFLALEKFKYKHNNTFNYFINLSDVNIKPEINVVICTITKNAINILSNYIKRDNIFTDQIINSLGDIFKDKISETREIFETYFKKHFPYTKTITFFDHKFPDYYSIIYNFVPLGIISRIYKDGDEITDNKSYIIKENVFKKQYPYESVKGMNNNNIYYYPFIKITNLKEEFENINYGHLIKPIYKRQDYKLPNSIIDLQPKYDNYHFN